MKVGYRLALVAALLLASPDYASAHGMKPRAKVRAMANMGDSPTLMLNAPVPAAQSQGLST